MDKVDEACAQFTEAASDESFTFKWPETELRLKAMIALWSDQSDQSNQKILDALSDAVVTMVDLSFWATIRRMIEVINASALISQRFLNVDVTNFVVRKAVQLNAPSYIFELLISKGAPFKDALHTAVRQWNRETVRTLLDLKADPNDEDESKSPILLAVRQPSEELDLTMFEYLLAKVSDLNAPHDVLAHALQKRERFDEKAFAVVRKLLDAKADPGTHDALLAAVPHDTPRLLQTLVDAKADVSDHCQELLWYAASFNSPRSARWVINACNNKVYARDFMQAVDEAAEHERPFALGSAYFPAPTEKNATTRMLNLAHALEAAISLHGGRFQFDVFHDVMLGVMPFQRVPHTIGRSGADARDKVWEALGLFIDDENAAYEQYKKAFKRIVRLGIDVTPRALQAEINRVAVTALRTSDPFHAMWNLTNPKPPGLVVPPFTPMMQIGEELEPAPSATNAHLQNIRLTLSLEGRELAPIA